LFSILGKNLPLKILSVFLAVLLWAVISRGTGGEMMEISLGIPLELHNLSKDMEVIQGPVERVDVRFSGPRRIVSKLSQLGLTIPMDLSGAADGVTTFEIFTSDIQVPERVAVTRVSPSSINLLLEKIYHKRVPVVLQTEGDPAEGYILGKPGLTPPILEIRGPGSFLAKIDRLFTPPIPVQGSTVTIRGETGVILPDSHLRVVNRSTIKYEILIVKKDEQPGFGN